MTEDLNENENVKYVYVPSVEYYAVYDRVSDSFGSLFPAKNDNAAWRSFEIGQKDAKDVNPADYDLYHIGKFNDTIKKKGFFSNIYQVSGIDNKDGE